jgi:Tol biopolymer transport system component
MGAHDLVRRLAVGMTVMVLAAGCVGTASSMPAPASTPAPKASATAAAPAPTQAPAPGPGALIAFIRTTEKPGGCGYDPQPTCPVARLWLIGSDGNGAHELLPDGRGNQGGLAWSPDGTHLVYTDDGKLYLTEANGSEPRVADTGCVAPCWADGDAAFSSDGTHLVFVRSLTDDSGNIGPAEIATMDLASGRVEELSSTAPAGGTHPGWSPDGRQIVFSRFWGKGLAAAFVVDADGQNLHQISPTTARVGLASWSPDGSRIVLTSFDRPVAGGAGDYHQDIYTVRPDGTDLRQLTTDGISNRATWAPDGRILFTKGLGFVPDGGAPGFWTMNADGSDAARLIPGMLAGDEWQWWLPAWQPIGGPSVVPPPWTPSTGTPVGPPPPAPSATPTPALSPGFSWTGSMNAKAEGFWSDTAALLADGRVLIVHACDTGVELYDPATGTFSLTGSLTVPRAGQTATLLSSGRVLIAGGDSCGGAEHPGIWASAELYDPATGTFSPTGSMSRPRMSHTATLLADGRVLIAGGITGENPLASLSVVLASDHTADTSAQVLTSAELYDPATGTFSRTGSMSDFRNSHTATLLPDRRVLVVGGGGEGYASRTSAELYDPATGTFRPTGSMTIGRWLHAATLLRDGRVLITGGRAPDDTTAATAEMFDPGSGRFSSAGSMDASRQQHTATLLRDGRVLIAGGYQQDGTTWEVLSSTELFDPGTGTFTPIGSMGDRRDGHTATLLDDGRVLIAGGTDIGDDGGVVLTSAVLYQP